MGNDPLMGGTAVEKTPPVGFGYTGEFAKLPKKTQQKLQADWDALTLADKDRVMQRSAHLRYDHEAFLAASL